MNAKHCRWCLCQLVVSLAVMSAGQMSPAAVFERDWKTPGDGLLTFDDVSQHSWLDLSETVGMSFEEVAAELGPGGMFEGFSTASRVDVEALVISTGIDITTPDSADNGNAADVLMGLLTTTDQPGPIPGSSSTGWTNEVDDGARWASGIYVLVECRLIHTTNPMFHPSYPPGVWLYRPIPEPSTLLLTILAATALLTSTRRWRR